MCWLLVVGFEGQGGGVAVRGVVVKGGGRWVEG